MKEEIETRWRAAAAAEFYMGNHGERKKREWRRTPHLKGDRAASRIVSCSSFNYQLEDAITYLV